MRRKADSYRGVDERRDPQTGVSDVTQLLSLTEESVMQNTMVRFSRDEIYTFVGSVLLAGMPRHATPRRATFRADTAVISFTFSFISFLPRAVPCSALLRARSQPVQTDPFALRRGGDGRL